MNKKMSKRQRDIKSKLMAAVAMLLVSSIMMVSTTYAWFTLSTAPEVTGITTSVGANGNLEMALMPQNALTAEAGQGFGITSASGDSMSVKSKTLANITWGNLVDLSDESYGLNTIKLYPAALNTVEGSDDAQGNPTTLGAALLKTPEYGSDGRVSQLLGNTVTGRYNGTAFNTSAETGVRAVGNASGMSPRQLAYRNALQAGSSYATMALNNVTKSLSANGAQLAEIAINHGTAGGNDTYGSADVATLNTIVTDLTKVLGNIETAYVNYIVAYVVSAGGLDKNSDTLAATFASTASSYTTISQLEDLLAGKVEGVEAVGVSIPATAQPYIDALRASQAKVNTAANELDKLSGENIPWSGISNALSPLLNTEMLTVSGFTVQQIKDNPGGFASAVMGGAGVHVSMPSGSGVYADIADHAGNYQAAIIISEIKYGEISMDNVNARMSTNAQGTAYLNLLNTAVTTAGAPSSEGSSADAPITDMYGYVIDLAFRTNASDSKLLLQTEAKGRIYGEQDSAETMGHGATMTFDSTVNDFTVQDVKNLMETIRIVFFDPTSNKVLATAKLDMSEVNDEEDVVGTSVTAPIKLYKNMAPGEATVTYREAAEGEPATHYESTPGVFLTADADHPATHVEVRTEGSAGGETWLTGNNAVITSLNQNTAHAVSVLVYMDGNTVTNADVAATGNTSAVGTMNLQFSSTATLVPMEYTALMNQGGAATEGTNPTAKLASGSADGVTLSDVAFADGTITFKLAGTVEGTTYTVTAGGETLTASAEGVYTINNVTADVEVTVTANA